MKLRRTFGVATGQSQYPTPLGRFHIVVKWRNPWWYPPASDWAKDAKPIPPGPGNPLGTRWMGISAPARRHPRHARRRVDRLLRLARLHPHADPRGGVAVRAGRDRHAGLRRPVTGRLRLVGAGRCSGCRARAARPARLEGRGRERQRRHRHARATAASRQAPVFELDAPRPGEGELALDSLRGKAVVLNFWASWCGPCKEETPLLEAAWQRWRKRDVVFVGVDVKDFRGDAPSTSCARTASRYPNVYDGKGSTVGRYGVTGFPETYFVDANGPRRLPRRRAGGKREDLRGRDRARALARHEARFSSRCWRSRSRRRRSRARSSRRRPSSSPSSSARSASRRSTRRTRRSRGPHEGVHPRADRAAGGTKSEIKAELVAQFGHGRARDAAEGGLRPARVGAAAASGSRSAQPRSACSPGAGAGGTG